MDSAFVYRPGRWNTGTAHASLPSDRATRAAIRNSMQGFLLAWDPVNQREAWRVNLGAPWNGGTLATAGGLVFQGTLDGHFRACRTHDRVGRVAAPDERAAVDEAGRRDERRRERRSLPTAPLVERYVGAAQGELAAVVLGLATDAGGHATLTVALRPTIAPSLSNYRDHAVRAYAFPHRPAGARSHAGPRPFERRSNAARNTSASRAVPVIAPPRRAPSRARRSPWTRARGPAPCRPSARSGRPSGRARSRERCS